MLPDASNRNDGVSLHRRDAAPLLHFLHWDMTLLRLTPPLNCGHFSLLFTST
jgi:hypothetical protein